MNAARIVGAGVSAAIHAALLIQLPVAVPVEPPRALPPAKDSGERDMRLLPSLPAGLGLACAGHYRGIGVVISWSGYVREVVAGGPADRAGLRAGDRFLNDSIFLRDQYPLNTALALRIERDGQPMNLPVRIDRICFDREAS